MRTTRIYGTPGGYALVCREDGELLAACAYGADDAEAAAYDICGVYHDCTDPAEDWADELDPYGDDLFARSIESGGGWLLAEFADDGGRGPLNVPTCPLNVVDEDGALGRCIRRWVR